MQPSSMRHSSASSSSIFTMHRAARCRRRHLWAGVHSCCGRGGVCPLIGSIPPLKHDIAADDGKTAANASSTPRQELRLQRRPRSSGEQSARTLFASGGSAEMRSTIFPRSIGGVASITIRNLFEDRDSQCRQNNATSRALQSPFFHGRAMSQRRRLARESLDLLVAENDNDVAYPALVASCRSGSQGQRAAR